MFLWSRILHSTGYGYENLRPSTNKAPSQAPILHRNFRKRSLSLLTLVSMTAKHLSALTKQLFKQKIIRFRWISFMTWTPGYRWHSGNTKHSSCSRDHRLQQLITEPAVNDHWIIWDDRNETVIVRSLHTAMRSDSILPISKTSTIL